MDVILNNGLETRRKSIETLHMDFILSNGLETRSKSLENLQISSNHDGTVNIKVTEKSVYFQEVANELHKTYKKYSDVKIVCGDGSRFDANRSILARLKHLSRYFLLPEIPTGEKLYLIVPDAISTSMKNALDWFYSNDNAMENDVCTLRFVCEIFGGFVLRTTTQFENEDVEEMDLGTMLFCQEMESEQWTLFCKKDANSGFYICPLCEEEFSSSDKSESHVIQSHGLKIHQSETIKQIGLSNNLENFDIETRPVGNQENDNLTKQQMKLLKYSFVCNFCQRKFNSKSSVYIHVAWEHVREKVLFLSQILCKKKYCRPKSQKLRSLVSHLVIRHAALKLCLKDQELAEISRKIVLCNGCDELVKAQNYLEHQKQCIVPRLPTDLAKATKCNSINEQSNKTDEGSRKRKNVYINCPDCNKRVSKCNLSRHLKVFCKKVGQVRSIINESSIMTQKKTDEASPKKRNVYIHCPDCNKRVSKSNFSSHLKVFCTKVGQVGYIINESSTLTQNEASSKKQNVFIHCSDCNKRVSKSNFSRHLKVFCTKVGQVRSIIDESSIPAQKKTKNPSQSVSLSNHISSPVRKRSFKPVENCSQGPCLEPYLESVKKCDLYVKRFLKEKNDKKSDVQKWRSNFKMIPQDGRVYIFNGTKTNYEEIIACDDYKWCDHGHGDNIFRRHFTYNMTKDLCALTGNFEYHGKAIMRKKIIFFEKKSLYFVHYYGFVEHLVRALNSRPPKSQPVGRSRTSHVLPQKELRVVLEKMPIKPGMLTVKPPAQSGCILTPFATNLTENTDLFLERILSNGSILRDNLQTFTTNMRIEPKVGNVYIFLGHQKDENQIKSADGLDWKSTGRSFSQGAHFFYYHQEEFLSKKIGFLALSSVFVVFYLKSDRLKDTVVKNGVAPHNGRITVTPHLTHVAQVSDVQTKLFENLRLDRIPVWSSNLRMDVVIGHLYLFVGPESQSMSLFQGDDLLWFSTKIRKGQSVRHYYYCATYDVAKMTKKELAFYGIAPKKHGYKRRVPLKKRISYFEDLSLHMVHYYGQQTQLSYAMKSVELQ